MMKRNVFYKLITLIMIMVFGLCLAAEDNEQLAKFEKVVNDMVKAINERNYEAAQKDFAQVMLEQFPLDKSKPFYENLLATYGKIQKLEAGEFVPPNQAIFPAVLERGELNIRLVLDNQDKIIGLWFHPKVAGEQAGDKGEDKKTFQIDDSKKPGDVNDVNIGDENLEELKTAFRPIELKGRKEIREWTRKTQLQMTTLAKAVNEQVIAELNFIREMAMKENALETAAAIDIILQNRKERFEEVSGQLEKLEERQRELEERKERARSRTQGTRETRTRQRDDGRQRRDDTRTRRSRTQEED